MEFQLIIAALLALVAVTMLNVSASKDVVTPPLCEPGIIEEMPPHIKKVCNALENSNQLSTALNAYIRNEAAALLVRGDDLLQGPGGTGKRTDVDHVFLRFGRRR